MTRSRIWLGVLMMLACAGVSSAEDHERDLEKQLRQTFVHKVLSLRTPYASSKLHFTSGGQLIGTSLALPWTTGGIVQVTKVSLKSTVLELEGNRVVIAWRSETNPSLIPLVTNNRVKVTLNLDSPILEI